MSNIIGSKPKTMTIAEQGFKGLVETASSGMEELAEVASTASQELKQVIDGGILGGTLDPFEVRATTEFGLTISKASKNEYLETYKPAATDPTTPSLAEVVASLPKFDNGVEDETVDTNFINMVDEAYLLYTDRLDYYDARIENAIKTISGGQVSEHDTDITKQFLAELMKERAYVEKQLTGLEEYMKDWGI